MSANGHSKFSASGASRWLACAGSVQLSEKAPPQADSAYAKEGTDAHFCLEQLLKNPKKQLSVIAKLCEKYPKQMVIHAEMAFATIMKAAPKGAEIMCEQKVDLSFVHQGLYGTLDCAIVEHFGELHVIDFKYGAGIAVDPEHNPQLIYYALGIAHKFDYNFDTVKLSVYQPRAEHERGPFRTWETTIDCLHDWHELFSIGVEAALSERPAFNAGAHCRFCPAAPICPEISKKAMEKALIAFDDTTGDLALPVPNKTGIAIANLPQILSAVDLLESWITKVREHAYQVALSGETIPGFKLVPKRAIRKWTNVADAEAKAKKLFGDKCLTAPELLSPAQLEKVLPKAQHDFIKKNVSNVSSGTTLVPETDSRQAVRLSDVFDVISPQGENQSSTT